MSRQAHISVRELASRLEVSVATVSRALNNHPGVAPETRTRVLELADRTGYMPRVGQRMTKLIGLVYPSQIVRPDLSSFEATLLSGILEGTNELSYDVTLINIERDKADSESYTQFFRRKGVRGVIVRNIVPGGDTADEIADEGFPCIMVADRSEHPEVSFLCCDSSHDSRRAVEHLARLGHQRIAMVTHSVLDSDHLDRFGGYREAIERSGLEYDDELMLKLPAGIESGAVALDRLLSMANPPTAAYIADPLTTVGALNHCLELGIQVPSQFSIVGFDDSDVRLHTFPQYTAVCQDAHMLGREAASWLSRTLDGMTSEPLREMRPTTLSFNQSTAVAPRVAARIETHVHRNGNHQQG